MAKSRTIGFRVGQGDWSGTLCPSCVRKSEARGESFDKRVPFSKGDALDIDVCEDCGKTIQRGESAN
jgi:hypothetical protein